MSAIRHEHRSLPFLIALGVLLGAGLALASPGGHAHHRRAATPTETASPSAAGSLGPTGLSTAGGGAGGSPDAACAGPEPTPGWSAGRGSLAHAIHVLDAPCHPGRGRGLHNAIARLQHARQVRPHGRPSSSDGHGTSGRRHAGHEHHAGQSSKHRHGSRPGGGSSSGGGGSGGGGPSTGGGSSGDDVVHGNGHDGLHGKDAHVSERGPTRRGPVSARPDLPATASDRARPNA
jgi:hypothetical protein